MNKGLLHQLKYASSMLLLAAVSGCSPSPSATPTTVAVEPPTSTSPPVSTATRTPVPASTDTPTATPLPGEQVYPITSLAASIPWLPLVEGEEPMTVYFGFNVERPPFNDPLVRQAFAAAIDREQVAEEATGFAFREVMPATSLTPSENLGRNLYGDVGVPFDPARARDLLAQAGYTTPGSFPSVLLVVCMRGAAAPGAYYRIAQSIVEMWQTNIGVSVQLETIEDIGAYLDRLRTDPPDIYQLGWGADYNDPDDFLRGLFHSGSDLNFGRFSNAEFDGLVDEAANLNDPAERQLLYIQAERILTEQEAAVIPLFHTLYYVQR